MNEIPLPTGLKGDSLTPKQIELVVNAYLERGARPTLSPRPGIESRGDIYGRCRGQGFFNGAVYRVSADKLFKITLNALGELVFTDTGAVITGSNDCKLIASFTELFVMVKNGDAFVVDKSDTVAQVIDGNYQAARDCEFINGRVVIVPYDGDPIRWSSFGDFLTWPAENFADAELLPDKNYHLIRYHNSLLVGGGDTIEQLNYDGQRNVYIKTSNAAIEHGVVSDFARFGERIVYIGKYNKGDLSVYMYGQEQPISSKYVDQILNKYTANELRDIQVDSFVWKGQPMVVWRLPGESLIYYGDFGIIKTGVSGDLKGNWLGQYIVSLEGRLLCGDNVSARVGELLEINSDYGEKVETIIRTSIRGTARDNFLVSRIVAACTTGQSNDVKEIELSVSEDGVHGYSLGDWTGLGVAGVYNNEISWGPIGRFDNYCGIQLRWVCDIRVPVDGVYFE